VTVRNKFYEELGKISGIKYTELKELVEDIYIPPEEDRVTCYLKDGKKITSRDSKLVDLGKMAKLRNIPLAYLLNNVVREPRSRILKRLWAIHSIYGEEHGSYKEFAASRKFLNRAHLSSELEEVIKQYDVGDEFYLFLESRQFIDNTKQKRFTPEERIRTTDEMLNRLALKSNKRCLF